MRYETVYVSERGSIKIYERGSFYILEINEDPNRQILIDEKEFEKIRDRMKLRKILRKLEE